MCEQPKEMSRNSTILLKTAVTLFMDCNKTTSKFISKHRRAWNPSLEQWEQKRSSLASDFKICRVILSKPAGAVIKTAAKPSGTLTIKKSKMEIHDGESKCKTSYYKKTLLKKRRITQRDWHKHLLCLEKDPQTHKAKANNKRSCIKLRRFCTKKQPKKGNDNQVEYSCKLCICQRINIHNI